MNQRRSNGFTLMELLMTVGIIMVLLAISMAAVRKVQGKARSTVCLNNLRQLGYGFQMYLDENEDTFPAGASVQHYGPQPEDWIWWHNGRDVRKSSLAPYVVNFAPGLFRCPSDEQAHQFAVDAILEGNPYRYSYSLTSFQNYDNFNPGLATLISRDRELVLPFKRAWVKKASSQILLVEESRKSLDDGRWVPGDFYGREWRPRDGDQTPVQVLTRRHNKLANVLFLDGHVEAFGYQKAFDLRHSNPFME